MAQMQLDFLSAPVPFIAPPPPPRPIGPARGAIHHEEAYARGKMLDHSDWQRGDKIVRLITPSDIDMCFDASGRIIFSEVSDSCDRWTDLSRGQRLLYESCVKGGPHCAVLCRHYVPLSERRPINTRKDISNFEIMLFDHELLYVGPYQSAAFWERFVFAWVDDPLKLRRKLLQEARRP